VLSAADVEYIRSGFVELDGLCRRAARDPAAVRAQIQAGLLPRPSYVLDDGSEMVPPDFFTLADEAGRPDRLRELFVSRYERAAAAEPDVAATAEEEWEAYLSGEYGVCLKRVTPETIVGKAALIARIETLLAEPRPDDSGWAGAVRRAVDELDALERQFAAFDRVRFGGPSSRDRLITGTRDAYPAIFERTGVAS
jgi:Family of unknown function (DUF6058)